MSQREVSPPRLPKTPAGGSSVIFWLTKFGQDQEAVGHVATTANFLGCVKLVYTVLYVMYSVYVHAPGHGRDRGESEQDPVCDWLNPGGNWLVGWFVLFWLRTSLTLTS